MASGMYDVRHKGFKFCAQSGRNIFLFQVMLLACCAEFVDYASDSLDFFHDNAPHLLIQLHFLSMW
jgi:hypothetical protein